MSRIGKKLIIIPQGVNVQINDLIVTVTGPKGTLSQNVDKQIIVKKDGDTITLTRTNETADARAKHGLYRALINNMIIGVSQGFTKKLEINGVGYKANKQGTKLVLNLGLSYPIQIEQVPGVTFSCPSLTEIVISGSDKQLVGQVASNIRDLRPVEPYHAYGIKYSDEIVIKKVGKKAGKK